MLWRHLTPRSKGYFVSITMVGFVLKGVNTRWDIYIRKIESKCNTKQPVGKELNIEFGLVKNLKTAQKRLGRNNACDVIVGTYPAH
jgi:hypothetical protein